MMRITREKEVLFIRVNTGTEVEKPIMMFTRGSYDEATAEIVRLHIQERLDAHMQEIRRVSYERGWQDAKKKRGKRQWFLTKFDLQKQEIEEVL